jgi:oligosaccharide amylase
MNRKPFLVDAVLGNSRMLVTLTRDAELQRLFWPHVDGAQQIERILGGVAVDGGPVRWQDSDRWQHDQAYEPDQNVLVTRSVLEGTLSVTATDAAVPGRDVFVRHLAVRNLGAEPVAVRYALYQWIRIDENPLYNTALFDQASDALVAYRRDTFVAVGADREMAAAGVGSPEGLFAEVTAGAPGGGTVLHGDVAGAAQWDLGTLEPGETVTLSLFWTLGQNISQVRDLLWRSREAGAEGLLQETRTYWTAWLSRAKPLQVPPADRATRTPYLPGLPAAEAPAADVVSLYRRSLLVFKLMSDEETGAVIAAPEFDPGFTACGGYAYCWGRDAAYITTAMDLAGYHDLAGQFYRWAVGAQEPDGWWLHRHYSSGAWGPSWGLIQVDETGSILYGMALHARLHGGEAFARSVWSSVAKAADWLIGNMDPETGLPAPSHDLWEERLSELTYSSAAVYGGLMGAAEMARLLGENGSAERWRAAADALRQAVLRECVRDGRFLRGRFMQVPESACREAVARDGTGAGRVRRGPKGQPVYELNEDPVPDSSLLGIAVPFGLAAPDEPVMRRTADALVSSLWTEPVGGMRRYAGDHYREGGNPWILCTLWLGLFEAERGDQVAARQVLDWAVARQTRTGMLAEQVDPVTGQPVWVVPLTWSHAMYVLLALKLYA